MAIPVLPCMNSRYFFGLVVIFVLLVPFFYMRLLPGVGKLENRFEYEKVVSSDSNFLESIILDLDFGQDFVGVQPQKVSARFGNGKESRERDSSYVRLGNRKPLLALVFADLAFDSYQMLMATVGAALQDLGYSIEVFSADDGPAAHVWRYLRVPVTIIQTKDHASTGVDWLNYNGILVNSLQAKGIISWLMQEPFKSLPLVWTINEKILATRFSHYTIHGKTEVLSDWKKCFNRATTVVFPNFVLPILYSRFDAGNYFVIPGAPAPCEELGQFLNPNEEQMNAELDIKFDDLVIAIVGSKFFYKGQWLEHALVLQALKPLLAQFPSENNSASRLKIFIVTGDATINYKFAVEAISAGLRYPIGTVKHVAGDAYVGLVLRAATLVIYGSFLEEQLFPEILTKAFCCRKLIIAPDLSMIKKYVNDGENGFLYPKENVQELAAIVSFAVPGGKLSRICSIIAKEGKTTARKLMVLDAIEGYAMLLESVLNLPSEFARASPLSDIPSHFKKDWIWRFFDSINSETYTSRTLSSTVYLGKIEQQHSIQAGSTLLGESFISRIWEEKQTYAANRREEEELKDRSEQNPGTWTVVYRNAKRGGDQAKNDLCEREDKELERIGQPISIYEPYFGEGIWPFLHHPTSLYRGISLCTRGKRPGADDIDACSNLPILSNTYYRDILGEVGAMFAIAHKIDCIHKNAWIGFHSWRLTARKVSLSKKAETALLNAIEPGKTGDVLYFWARMDLDPRTTKGLDFWSFCDSINAGNCRSTFSKTIKRMYGITNEADFLPPMPVSEDTWSVMHSWALPTKSFLEFVMFARMFVDEMDVQMFDEHHKTGFCDLSIGKDPHCYSRIIELLVSVWAYHSSRRMVCIDPETGVMEEHHELINRRGQMWVHLFSYETMKKIDEQRAKEVESDPNNGGCWLWPLTGEVSYSKEE